MAWLGLDKLFLGTDLEAEQQRSNALDAQLKAENDKLLARGVWTDEDYAKYLDDLNRKESAYNQNVDSEVNAAFVEGLNDGVANIRDKIGKATTFAVSTPLKLIPWQIWVIGLAVLAFYLFAPRILKKALA